MKWLIQPHKTSGFEVYSYSVLGGKAVDRSGSLRHHDHSPYMPKLHGKKVRT